MQRRWCGLERKRTGGLILGAAALLLLGADPCAPPVPTGGFVDEAYARERALDYLRFATQSHSGSILNAIAHMERDLADPDYTAPSSVVDETTWAASYEKLDKLLDTRDFDGLYLLNALLGYEGHPYLTPAAWERVRTALLSFKMWYTDPTPLQPDPDRPERDWDDSFYWTENHQILYHTIEYLAGQRFPSECFWIVGFARTPDCSAPHEMTGAAHVARARGFILRWLDERWEGGFAEWHSNIYLQKDLTPLKTLVAFAQDPEIRTRAAMILDVALLDLATNTFRGVYGVTHGRSAMKDKHRGPTNDTWGIALLLFDQRQEFGYQSTGDAAVLFARDGGHRLPEVILEAARSDETFVERTRQSFAVDERAASGIDPGDPSFPPGHPFEDTEPSFTFWWGLGAWTIWQVVPLTLVNADRYNLWPTSLLQPFLPLRDLVGSPPDLALADFLAKSLWPAAAVGLLKEVNTYTYRTRDYILSTAQDYRKGANSGQVHAWQATLGSDALVFTQHPMNPVQPPSEWLCCDEGEPGYWTGTASMPRSAQHENVGIHIYSPVYPDGGLFGFFDFEAVTHAYFPREHFDEWDQAGPWTFGRKGDGYVALYSWRPTFWQDYPPAELALLPPSQSGPIQMSFDLVAPGGADNVWIVECGRRQQWGSFAAFKAAILAAPVLVTPRVGPIPGIQEFDVAYTSPSQGALTFGWSAPLRVNGVEIPIRDYPRVANPWLSAPRGARRLFLEGRRGAAILDWDGPLRQVFAKPQAK